MLVSYFTTKFDDEVVRLLKSGGVGFMPSDTIYGLSCRALDKKAVERIHALKRRDSGKPCIVLISKINQLKDLNIDSAQAGVMEEYWPGKISLEFNAPDAPTWLHLGLGRFAVRMPDDKELLRLIDGVGPIISTSANIQGDKPAISIEEAKEYFGDQLDFYIDSGKIHSEPSTIVIFKDGKLKVDRPGAVKIKNEKSDVRVYKKSNI